MLRQSVPYPKGWKKREWKHWIDTKYGKQSHLYQNFTIKRSISVYCENYRKAMNQVKCSGFDVDCDEAGRLFTIQCDCKQCQ